MISFVRNYFFCFFFLFVSSVFGQKDFLQLDPMLENGITVFERFEQYSTTKYAFQNEDFLKPSEAMLYSFLVPGLGQYLNGDEVKAFIYIGLEASAWYLNFHFNQKGDEGNQIVEDYANNPTSGFNRVEYYRGIYEAVNGSGSAPAVFSSSGSEEEVFQQIKGDASLYSQLKSWEKNDVGDGVHSLPDKKTQQYYEMIGKYRMFYHGWLALSDIDASASRSLQGIPEHIERYYDKRDAMNAAYEKATWAVSGIVVNHVISAIEAYISTKRKWSASYQSLSYRNETIPAMQINFQF